MKKTGSMNHVRFTVSDIPHAESFYNPLLGYMGYELA
jgi:catechol-2,3-dioxygenase